MLRRGRSFSGRERHCCLLNTSASPDAKRSWATVSAVSGLDLIDDGRACAIADWDHDGDLDMWISNRTAPRLRFMRNNISHGGDFLALRLQANETTSNRDAIGARVEVTTINPSSKRQTQVKTLRAGSGFLAQSSKWLHFGLGNKNRVERVTVHWPGTSQPEEFRGVSNNDRFILVQGSSRVAKALGRHPVSTLDPAMPDLPPQTGSVRLALTVRLPGPSVSYRDFNGREASWSFADSNKGLLVNLWSSSCRPCLEELQAFTERAEDIRTAGIDIVALAVDGLDGTSQSDDATIRVEQLGLAFPAGLATGKLLRQFQGFHDLFVPLQLPMPLPASFLYDKHGRVAVIYKGQVSVDDLIEDAISVNRSTPATEQLSSDLPGQFLQHPVVKAMSVETGLSLRLKHADNLRAVRRHTDALDLYSEILQLQPDSAYAYNNRGTLYEQLERFSEAKSDFLEALRIDPELGPAHNNLANSLRKEGDLNGAQTHYRQAVVLAPDSVEAYYNLGVLYFEQGDIASAKSVFSKASQIDPKNASIQHALAVAMERLGNRTGAEQHYQRALELNPRNESAKRSLEQLRNFNRSQSQ